ncbi:ATP synthase subunit alpha [Dirofilaria immitis]
MRSREPQTSPMRTERSTLELFDINGGLDNIRCSGKPQSKELICTCSGDGICNTCDSLDSRCIYGLHLCMHFQQSSVQSLCGLKRIQN